jgi:DNA polymerase I-like protein with 3'-5' exonuclease and polymerase domains
MIELSKSKNYYLIESRSDVDKCIDLLSYSSEVAFDTETTGLNTRQDKVIGLSFSTEENQGYYYPIYEWNIIPHHHEGGELVKCPDFGLGRLLEAISNKHLIMHNGGFDTKICFHNLQVDLLTNFKADTQLMRHTLQEEGPFALKDIAIELADKIGISQEEVANQEQLELEENVKSNGGSWKKSDKEIYKADLKVLAKYACADTDLTLRLFNYFEKELKVQKLHDFFYKEEVMPVYKYVTIPMEFEGIYIDMQYLIKSNNEIILEIESIKQSITSNILKSEEGVEFVSLRAYKEYPPSNKGSYAQGIAKYYNLNIPKSPNGKYSLTKTNIEKLEDCPAKFYLQGESVDLEFSTISKILLEEDGPLINLGSKQQLGNLVFDIMKVEPLSKTEKGSPQFNEDTIDHLAEVHKVTWAKELRVYNKLNKIKSSYYDRFLEGQEDGIFYPSFKQHGTTSGRFASDMQQLSKPLEDDGLEDPRVVKFTNTLRKLFIPKPDYVFIDDDYESLEPRVFADDAGDQALIDIFELGEDFYSKVAIQTEGLTGVSAHKKDPTFLKNLHPNVRQDAKAYSLGIRYGMKSGKLAQALNIDKELAQEKIDNYFKAFPNLKKAMDGYLKQAKQFGVVKSKYGRIRHLPRAKAIHDKYSDDILEYSNLSKLARKFYKSYDDLKMLRKEYNNLLNNALNFPIQAAATSIVNRAMLAMTLKFRELGLDAWVSLQIHDQIVVSCHKDCIEPVKQIVQDCMENTNKLSMKLIAKPEVALNLADGH